MRVAVGVPRAVLRPEVVAAGDAERIEQLPLRELLQWFADGQFQHVGQQVDVALAVGEDGAWRIVQRHAERLHRAVRVDRDHAGDALGQHTHPHAGGFGEQIFGGDRPVLRVAEPRGEVPVYWCVEIEFALIPGDSGEQGDDALGRAPDVPRHIAGLGVGRPLADETVVPEHLHVESVSSGRERHRVAHLRGIQPHLFRCRAFQIASRGDRAPHMVVRRGDRVHGEEIARHQRNRRDSRQESTETPHAQRLALCGAFARSTGGVRGGKLDIRFAHRSGNGLHRLPIGMSGQGDDGASRP